MLRIIYILIQKYNKYIWYKCYYIPHTLIIYANYYLICNRINNMDSIALGLGWSNTMKAWAKMLPYTVDPYLDSNNNNNSESSKQLKEFWRKYDLPFTNGCLFSGAGGEY